MGQPKHTTTRKRTTARRPRSTPARQTPDVQAAPITFNAGTELPPDLLTPDDHLFQVMRAFRESGYGGDLRIPLLCYLCATTRLLPIRPGKLPAHFQIIGTESSGKNFILDILLTLLPLSAFEQVNASSQKALVYEEEPYWLKHRLLVMSEIDSVPTSGPAASWLRTLLQHGTVEYRTVEDIGGAGEENGDG